MRKHEPGTKNERCKHCGIIWSKLGEASQCIWRTGEEPHERRISALDDFDALFTRVEELRAETQDGMTAVNPGTKEDEQ